jgi:transcriptional regulator with XRE-family HTH domain
MIYPDDKALNEARLRSGLNKMDLVRKTGLGTSTISNMLLGRGMRAYKYPTVRRVLEVLGVPENERRLYYYTREELDK